MNLSEGTTLQGGKYRIEKCLGQGGFGITYLAEWKQREAKVAIKEFFIQELCYRDEQSSQITVLSEGGRRTVEHFRKKFLREAETIFNLNHPNIIRIYDVFEENGTAYYVMEYHSNGSLQDKLKELRGPMAEADALRYIRQVADALAYIHGLEVVEEKEGAKKRSLRHLDVKPGNIMLNQRGEAVLIDFGLVKVYNEEGKPFSIHSFTLNGYSPLFSPIEQIHANKDTVFTPATDIYALGATLYNLVEGTDPPTIDKVASMKGDLPFSNTTSQSVRKAATKAMQLNAEDRPQTIDEFLRLLPQKAENDPSAVYKKELAESVTFFQASEYVEAISRFRVLLQAHPDHKAEIEEWMMKCTEKMSAQGRTIQRGDNPPTPPVPSPGPTPKPKPWREIGEWVVTILSVILLGIYPFLTPYIGLPGYVLTAILLIVGLIFIFYYSDSGRKKGDKDMERAIDFIDKARKEYSKKHLDLITKTFTVNGVSFAMVHVVGGTFQMGATSEQETTDSDENPVHSVTLSSYSIGQTEVTQALWKAVMGNNPSYFKGDNLPVEQVSWNDCQTFIRKLNALTGRTFRLPTEAEWEFAARGGTLSRGYLYAGSNDLESVAWYRENADKKTHPVATKSANELGLYDMSGNVSEWCQDWKGSYSSSSQTSPIGPFSGSRRVSRGGCWSLFARSCRVANRHDCVPFSRNFSLGLRLAL